jgi:outer membrane receptor for ferrienterochelin and colicins
MTRCRRLPWAGLAPLFAIGAAHADPVVPVGPARPVSAQAQPQPAPAGPPAPVSDAPERDRPPAEADVAEPAPAAEAEPEEQGEPRQDDEVIVIDSRNEKPLGNAVGVVEVVDRAAIRARGARNVADALRGRIGLEVVPSLRGTGVRAQGLDPAYVLILIDGLPAIGRVDGALDLERLPVETIERIEVIKGPSSALYGSDALGGVINIVTRDADRPLSAEASAVYGSRDRIDASATAAARREAGPWRLSSRAALGMRRSDGWDLDPSTIGTQGSSERAADGALRLAAARGDWRIAAAADYLRQDLRGVDDGGIAVYDRRTLAENGAGTLAATYRPRSDTSFAATLRHSIFRDQFLYDQRDGTALDDYQETEEQMTSATLAASSLLGEDHLLTGGLDGSVEQLSAERLSDDGSRERLGIYAQDEWLVARRRQLILVPGGRVDLDSQFGVHATPKLAARWDPTERVIARASAAMGYRAPDFRQLLLRFENQGAGYRVEGNPDLDPETSVGWNVSMEVEPIENVSVAAQGYWNEVDDLIAIDVVETPDMGGMEGGETMLFQYVNIASARTRGVEMQARARLGRWLVASVGYTLADTLDRQADHDLPDRARHRGNVEIRVKPIERLTVAGHGELVGRRYFYGDTDGDGEEDRQTAGRHAWLGARAELGVIEHLSLFAGVENIADAGDTQFFPIAPRAFYAGVRGTYDSPDEP